MQKRVLLFSHDGGGLGHLSRLGRIAAELQGVCASLVVTGLRQAGWLVPETCGVLNLPSWDLVKRQRPGYWNRSVWLELTHQEALRMRRELLDAILKTFVPDALVVDYLPFGQFNELETVLRRTSFKRYFILRGIVDTSDHDLLTGNATRAIGECFDRIFVTADRQVVDVATEYRFEANAAEKLSYVGYVGTSSTNRNEVRLSRGLEPQQYWVVCSGGGGKHAERFLQHCVEVARAMPKIQFDVIFGPRSNEVLSITKNPPPNCRVRRECRTLAELHGSCDVVVTSGGFNSIMESVTGGAHLIVFPSRQGLDDEQHINATRLARYYPVTILRVPTYLQNEIQSTLSRLKRQQTRPTFPLDTLGAKKIRENIFADLGFKHDLR